jgi:septal ring factor EnvC (AmiA/AmiB activator)
VNLKQAEKFLLDIGYQFDHCKMQFELPGYVTVCVRFIVDFVQHHYREEYMKYQNLSERVAKLERESATCAALKQAKNAILNLEGDLKNAWDDCGRLDSKVKEQADEIRRLQAEIKANNEYWNKVKDLRGRT